MAFLLSATILASEKPITKIDVWPYASLRPTNIHFRILVPRNPDNRLLRVQIDNEEYFRASDFQIDGDIGRAVFEDMWRDVPCGAYVLTATLVRQTEKPYTAKSNLIQFCQMAQ